jgi:hypothetical protein
MDLIQLIDVLHAWTKQYQTAIVVRHQDTIIIAFKGDVSTTQNTDYTEDTWQIPIATHIAVWWLQNPTKPFQAMTSALIEHDA